MTQPLWPLKPELRRSSPKAKERVLSTELGCLQVNRRYLELPFPSIDLESAIVRGFSCSGFGTRTSSTPFS